jgi:hypothetical protein
MAAPVILIGGFRESRVAQKGQQATLTGTLRVFVLTVRNREANQAPPGPRAAVISNLMLICRKAVTPAGSSCAGVLCSADRVPGSLRADQI